MTGRELIIYILQNNLEDAHVIDGGSLSWFMNEEEAAVKFNVGVATIRTWYEYGLLPGVKLGDSIFCLKHLSKPKGEIINEN